MFTPKLIVCLKEGYNRKIFIQDLLAGITVGVISIPLAMAFAIASGVKPEQGLYTAVVAGFLISALGGSRVQIGGPTGAFVVVLYSVVQRHGVDGLALATLMAGALLVVMGLARLGGVIKYIPAAVITGFTAGIALLIFTGQMKDFLGISHSMPPDFIGKWETIFHHIPALNITALEMGLASIAILVLCKYFIPKIPAPILVVVFSGLAVYLFSPNIMTIGSAFGGIPHNLPSPTLPPFSFQKMAALFPDAVTIALLGAIEALLSAVVADGMTGFNHKSNAELVAQGIANIASVLFGGIAATGALARTATNAKAGAKTPVAGMTHAVTVLLCMLFFAPLAVYIPLAALSGILIVVAWNMSEFDHIRKHLCGSLPDKVALLTAFVLTILVDLTSGVLGGVVVHWVLRKKG